MSIGEMCKLQGFPLLGCTGVSACGIGGMLGNAMSLNVVVRILALALPSVGLRIPSGFVDPRELLQHKATGSPTVDGRLNDSVITGLLRIWSVTVTGPWCTFSSFLRSFCFDRLPVRTSRWRDLLPLPRPIKDISLWNPIVGEALGLTILEMVCGCLNCLFLGEGNLAVPSSSTALHRHVFRRVQSKLTDMFSELEGERGDLRIRGSFERLTSVSSESKFPQIDFLTPPVASTLCRS